MMATSYWSPDGKPISANQMVEKLYRRIAEVLQRRRRTPKLWSKPATRKALLQVSRKRNLVPNSCPKSAK